MKKAFDQIIIKRIIKHHFFFKVIRDYNLIKSFWNTSFLLLKGVSLFWKKNPALGAACTLFFALLHALGNIFGVFAFLILLFFLGKKEKLLCMLFFQIVTIAFPLYYQNPHHDEKGFALFSIEKQELKKHERYSHKIYIHHFENERKISHIPCKLLYNNYLDPSFVYKAEGLLKPLKKGVSFKPFTAPIPLKKRVSLLHLRRDMKEKTHSFLVRNLASKEVSFFISSLITGETYDDIQRHVFANLGLAHLFAISGFHFSLFAFVFHFFLRIFFQRKVEAGLLLVILSFFFVFIGCAPSVERAFFVSIFSLIALLMEKEQQSLNTFGLSMLCVLMTNPLFVRDLGFILSFLATGGILLFYPSFKAFFGLLFPPKKLHELKQKKLLLQYSHIITSFLKNAMSLNLAVHITLFPILMTAFHKFPLHSLIYNLFFPFLVSIALILLVISLPFALIPVLGKALFAITNGFTSLILKIPNTPFFPQRTWYWEIVPKHFTPIYLITLFFGGILLQYYLEKKRKAGPLDWKFF